MPSRDRRRRRPATNRPPPALSSTMSRARARAAGRARADDAPRSSARIAAAQRLERRLGEAEVSRVQIERVHRAVAALGHLRVAGGRDLVEAVRAVHDPCALGPEQRSARASSSVSSGRGTPTSCRVAPRRVRQRPEQVEGGPQPEFAARRPRVPHRRMERRREENAIPASARQRSATAGGAAMFTPSASSTSALPHWLDTERLPCFATGTPHAAITTAAAVEILKVPERSPPVPHVSNTSAAARLELHSLPAHRPASPTISSGRSPFMASATRAPAIVAGWHGPT